MATTIIGMDALFLHGGVQMIREWYVCMFWGGAIVFLMACFFFVSVYAASALDDFKQALGAMKHD